MICTCSELRQINRCKQEIISIGKASMNVFSEPLWIGLYYLHGVLYLEQLSSLSSYAQLPLDIHYSHLVTECLRESDAHVTTKNWSLILMSKTAECNCWSSLRRRYNLAQRGSSRSHTPRQKGEISHLAQNNEQWCWIWSGFIFMCHIRATPTFSLL